MLSHQTTACRPTLARLCAPAAALAVAVALSAGVALAQPRSLGGPGGGGGSSGTGGIGGAPKEEALLPPTISGKSDESQVWAITGSFFFIVLTLVVTMIPPKRGHQD
jgi:hypothetical protein